MNESQPETPTDPADINTMPTGIPGEEPKLEAFTDPADITSMPTGIPGYEVMSQNTVLRLTTKWQHSTPAEKEAPAFTSVSRWQAIEQAARKALVHFNHLDERGALARDDEEVIENLRTALSTPASVISPTLEEMGKLAYLAFHEAADPMYSPTEWEQFWTTDILPSSAKRGWLKVAEVLQVQEKEIDHACVTSDVAERKE